MRKPSRSTRTRKTWLVLSFAMACMVAVVCTAWPNGGPWVNKHRSGECPEGQICADWEAQGLGWSGSCCIDQEYDGSPDIDACVTMFRHIHGEGQ